MKNALVSVVKVRDVATLIGLAVTLTAPSGAAPSAPRPDFSSWKFYTGTWTCTQIVRGRPSAHTAVTAIDPSGVWMIEHDITPVTGTRYLTFDASIRRWVEVGVNGAGAYWVGSSPGWHGNNVVFTTKGLDGSVHFDSITKDSDTARHDDFHGTDSRGRTYQGTSHCTKTRP